MLTADLEQKGYDPRSGSTVEKTSACTEVALENADMGMASLFSIIIHPNVVPPYCIRSGPGRC